MQKRISRDMSRQLGLLINPPISSGGLVDREKNFPSPSLLQQRRFNAGGYRQTHVKKSRRTPVIFHSQT
jgi:hypothetical protein